MTTFFLTLIQDAKQNFQPHAVNFSSQGISVVSLKSKLLFFPFQFSKSEQGFFSLLFLHTISKKKIRMNYSSVLRGIQMTSELEKNHVFDTRKQHRPCIKYTNWDKTIVRFFFSYSALKLFFYPFNSKGADAFRGLFLCNNQHLNPACLCN